MLKVDAQAAHPVHLVEHTPDLGLDSHHRGGLVKEARELGHAPRRANTHQLAEVHLEKKTTTKKTAQKYTPQRKGGQNERGFDSMYTSLFSLEHVDMDRIINLIIYFVLPLIERTK